MLLGGAVLAVGLAMTVLPGPAVVVIPIWLIVRLVQARKR